jgi:hypothetical protein
MSSRFILCIVIPMQLPRKNYVPHAITAICIVGGSLFIYIILYLFTYIGVQHNFQFAWWCR